MVMQREERITCKHFCYAGKMVCYSVNLSNGILISFAAEKVIR